jgi:hypothetical protein
VLEPPEPKVRQTEKARLTTQRVLWTQALIHPHHYYRFCRIEMEVLPGADGGGQRDKTTMF